MDNKPKLTRHSRLFTDEDRRKNEIMIVTVRLWRTAWYLLLTYLTALGITSVSTFEIWPTFVFVSIANLFWMVSGHGDD